MSDFIFEGANKVRSVTYQSLVIRYWQEHHPTQGPLWRCSLIIPKTGRQKGFKSFVELSAFLANAFEEGTLP